MGVVFDEATRRDDVHRELFGVIAEWWMISTVRAGNTVVIKPSEYNSVCRLELVVLVNTGLPPGVINRVSGGPCASKEHER